MRYEFKEPTFLVSDALDLDRADQLKQIVRWLSHPKPWPTRKADMIAAIERRLTGESLQKLWNRLDRIQQLAIREAIYTTYHGYESDQFEAKYGILPEGCEGHYGRDLTMPFRLFLYHNPDMDYASLYVPDDLAARLRKFIPKPSQVSIRAKDELPDTIKRPTSRASHDGKTGKWPRVELTRRNMERVAIQDLKTVLQLIDLGRVAVSAKTRLPTAAATSRITEMLDGGDFYDPTETNRESDQTVGSIRAFAWPMLVQNGKLAELRGTKLALTKKGYSALTIPASDTLLDLWNRWLDSTMLDEFSRINEVKGQTRGKGRRAMTAVAPRREVIVEALTRCPVERWIRFDDFSKFMRASRLEFDITHDEWSLYLDHPEYGSFGYADSHTWECLQSRYMLCLLFEYAATLGLIDVAYTHPENARDDFYGNWGSEGLSFLSRYDGFEFFRLNALGAYCLGHRSTYEPSSPPNRTTLTVFPDLRLQTHGVPTPDEQLTLETFASAEAEDIWRLARDKTLMAIENGQNIDTLQEFLSTRDDQPLPEMVEGFLRSTKQAGKALKKRGTAILIECDSEEIATRLASDKRTAKLCLRAGETHLVVQSAKEDSFRKAARVLGFPLPKN